MMYKKPSRRWVALKAAYLLPLGALSLVAFARPQVLTEIEKTVEDEVVHYTGRMKALVAPEPTVAAAVKPIERTAAAEPSVAAVSEPDDWSTQAADDAQPDANLVQADLHDNPDAAVLTPALTEKRSMAVLDSVMQAVGARWLGPGAYIGHFQPSLNNDTVRLVKVEFLDKASHKTAELTFHWYDGDPYAYKMTLQAGTRKGEKGYYIRYLTPVKATGWTYDKPEGITD